VVRLVVMTVRGRVRVLSQVFLLTGMERAFLEGEAAIVGHGRGKRRSRRRSRRLRARESGDEEGKVLLLAWEASLQTTVLLSRLLLNSDALIDLEMGRYAPRSVFR
jgi:hypothetical protein